MKSRQRFSSKLIFLGLWITTIVFPINLTAGELKSGAPNTLFIHMITDANKNDANACVAFNIAWVAVEKGLSVEMLFDSWAGYNIKKGDYWAKYNVPEHYRKLVSNTVGKKVEWQSGSYMDLLKYLKQKGMIVSANKPFLALSGDDKKLPSFIKQLTLDEMVNHIRQASSYITY